MSGILVVVLVFFALSIALGGVAYLTYRKKLRRAKAIERGLKMVPILIHLPPPSADTQGGSRDLREVMREKTSQAEVLYNLLAGTATEGFKSNFYGQRHIALELIVIDGMVHFFAAVPVALVSVVKKAVQTAYPGARLEEVEDHNIFNQEGRLAATLGGEMVLRAESAYPIATYDQLERDPMEALLTTVSALEKQDGVAIQIMLRPAGVNWTKRSVVLADSMRKGRSADLKFTALDLVKAAVKSPTQQMEEEKAKTGGSGVSNLKLSQVERIEDKTKHPGFEVLIRVIVSTGSVVRSQQLLRDIATAFALFENPGMNGFKFLPALDVQGLVTAFIFRFFPNELKGDVLNSAELATLFHLPDSQFTPTKSIERQTSKQVDGPVHLPTAGLLFGYNEFRGVKKEIRLSVEDRRRHTYILGQTGTGKSTMLENLAVQDMLAGNGFAFIDPHGDSAEKLLALVPKDRSEDVIYFNPADMQYPLGLNLFEFNDPTQKDFLVQETINMLYKLYDPGGTGVIGPRFEHWYRNAALTLMSDPNGSTFLEIPKVFTDTDYLKNKFKYLKDPSVIDFWTKEMGQTSDYHKSEMLGWFVSKFGAFQNNEMMRNIIGQTKSSFNIREVMDQKKILIVNLSKGRVGDLNAKLLGMIFVIKFQAAAMSRADIPEDQRTDFSLYVDEFQNFSTDSFASILSEARKYRLNLIVANQFIGQLSNEIRDAVFGNIGTIIAHRMGPDDAEFLVKQFAPVFDASDLMNIQNYQAAMRLMVGGLPSQPFSILDSAPLGSPNVEMGLAIKQLSAAKYGRDRAVVEADLLERLTGQAPAASAAALAPRPAPPPAPAGLVGVAATVAAPGFVAAPTPAAAAMAPVFAGPQVPVATAVPTPVAAPTPVAVPAPIIATPAPPVIEPVMTAATVAVAQPNYEPVAAAAPPAYVTPADVSMGDPLAALSVATSEAPLPLQSPIASVVGVVPPIGAPPVQLNPIGTTRSALSEPNVPVPVPYAEADATNELANQMAASADRMKAVELVPAAAGEAPIGPRTPPPIGAPPVDLPEPGLTARGPAQNGAGTLSLADITGDKLTTNSLTTEPSAAAEVPLLDITAESSDMGNGEALPNDPYADIDILGEGVPDIVEDEPAPEIVSEQQVSDGTALPDDPYGDIDILGGGPVGMPETSVAPELQSESVPIAEAAIEPEAEPQVVMTNEAADMQPQPVPMDEMAIVSPDEIKESPEPALVPAEIAAETAQYAVEPAVTEPEVTAPVSTTQDDTAAEALVPDWSNEPEPPVSEPVDSAASDKPILDEPLIHFVNPADETLLLAPEKVEEPDKFEEPSLSLESPSLNGLPEGVKLVTPEVVPEPLEVAPTSVLPPTVQGATEQTGLVTEPKNLPLEEVAATNTVVSAPITLSAQTSTPTDVDLSKELDSIVSVTDGLLAHSVPVDLDSGGLKTEESQSGSKPISEIDLAPAKLSVDATPSPDPHPVSELAQSPVINPALVPLTTSDLKLGSSPGIDPVPVIALSPQPTPEPTAIPELITEPEPTPILAPDSTPVLEPIGANIPPASLTETVPTIIPGPKLLSEPKIEPISAHSQILKAEHEIDDLVGASLIHVGDTPTHHRLPDVEEHSSSEDEEMGTGIDIPISSGSSKTDDAKHNRQSHYLEHHGLKVIQPLSTIDPTSKLIADELTVLKKPDSDPQPMQNYDSPQPLAPPEDQALPPAQSLAAVDVAKAHQVAEPVIQQPIIVQAAIEAPTPEVVHEEAVNPATDKHEAAVEPLAKNIESQAPVLLPLSKELAHMPEVQNPPVSKNVDDIYTQSPIVEQNHDDKTVEKLIPWVAEEQIEPTKPVEEVASLPGKLILPTGIKPSAQAEPAKVEKPIKLAPGEVFVDETGNVVIGE